MSLLVLRSGTSWAQSTEADKVTTGRALWEAGAALVAQENYREACPKFEGALKVDPGRSAVLFDLARCYELSGKLASARTTYVQAADLASAAEARARTEGDVPRAEREKARATSARERMTALAPTIPTLTLTVVAASRAIPGLTISRDGLPADAGQWGVALPIDPGEHAVVASAAGHKTWTGSIKVVPAQKAVLEVPELADEVVQAVPPVPPSPPPSPPEPAPPHGFSPRAVAGIAVGVVGLAGMGAGVGMGFAAKSKYASATPGDCTLANVCTEAGLDIQRSARSIGTAGTVVFIVGAAAVVTGGVVWITTLGSKGAPSSARAGLSPTGFVAEGAW